MSKPKENTYHLKFTESQMTDLLIALDSYLEGFTTKHARREVGRLVKSAERQWTKQFRAYEKGGK